MQMSRNAAQDDERQPLKDQWERGSLAPAQAAFEEARSAIAAHEQQLAAKAAELDAKEARLEAAAAALGAAANGSAAGAGAILAAQWAGLSAERQALAARWQCLSEDKRSLNIASARRRGGPLRSDGEGDDPQPFEPGALPIQDVSCAIIAHQVDIPCTSCCFQR